MRYEWDSGKRATNLAKHGVDFADIDRFEWDSALTVRQIRFGERRYVAVGNVAGRLHVVVYSRRGRNRRIISFRKANRREEQRYEQAQRVN